MEVNANLDVACYMSFTTKVAAANTIMYGTLYCQGATINMSSCQVYTTETHAQHKTTLIEVLSKILSKNLLCIAKFTTEEYLLCLTLSAMNSSLPCVGGAGSAAAAAASSC